MGRAIGLDLWRRGAGQALSTALVSGLLLTLAFGAPASAFALLQQSGQTGDYGVRSGGPEAKCGYTGPGNPGGVILRCMKVFPLLAGPATGSSQKVSWTVTIQKSTANGTTWKTIETAATQTGKATTTTNPGFKTVTVSLSTKPTVFHRALSTLKWLTNGSPTGLIKMRMTDYGVKVGHATNSVDATDLCSGQLLD